MEWHVYLLCCADGTCYCGITTDIRKRLAQHNGLIPGGARYTRSRRPVELLAFMSCSSRSQALRTEYRIKHLPRRKKTFIFHPAGKSMLTLEVTVSFFITALLLGIAPGPDIIFVLTQSALYGVKAGVFTTFGLATGLVVQTFAVALGVAAIFHIWPFAFSLLKLCGAAWLCRLAYLAFCAKPEYAGSQQRNSFPGCRVLYMRGIIMNVTNPKVCVFFLAFLPQFCDPARGSLMSQTLLLGGLFIIATLIVFCVAAGLGGKLAQWLKRSAAIQLAINRIAGCVFIGLALSLFIVDF